MKFGTILYRKGSDLLVSLSWALGRMHDNSPYDLPCDPPCNQVRNEDNHDRQLQVITEAAHIINEHLHSEIAKMGKNDLLFHHDTSGGFDLENLMNQSDPIIQHFLEVCTCAIREHSRRRTSACSTRSEPENHKKQMRQFFIKCLLMYCTNSRTPTPFHVLLSDTVEVCGGSRKLMRILNQLGVVASPDTHDRYVTSVVEKMREKSVWDYISNKIFTLASVDNFDVLKSQAAVYCGDQYRSYHGTTIQIAQPLPDLCLATPPILDPKETTIAPLNQHPVTDITMSVLNNRQATTAGENSQEKSTNVRRQQQPIAMHTSSGIHVHVHTRLSTKRKPSSSPTNSPHKLGKKGPKRRRTVAVRNLANILSIPNSVATDTQSTLVTSGNTCTCTSKDQQLNENTNPISMTPTVTVTESTCIDMTEPPGNTPEDKHTNPESTTPTITPATSGNTCTLEGFQEQSEEKQEMMTLRSKSLAYMATKQVLKNGKVLKELKTLISESTTINDSGISNLYYMELLDEHPDSSDTMRHVPDILLQHASSKSQEDFVVLIGDGKTYEHLMDIKRLYGAELDKLLIFPGDWHILYNYQPVLMKIYYHAGLLELAKASGYRGETLTSLQKCTNFKRTHHFLFQVWQAIYRTMIIAFTNSHPESLHHLIEGLSSTTLTPENMLKIVENILATSKQCDEFHSFVNKQSDNDSTWKFWAQFVFEDCMAYIGLFLSIRCRNWNLRVSSLKLMAPLFCAYDRTTYQRLIPNHLAAIQTFPPKIIECFKKGGFAINLKGGNGHYVGLDEAHEMCINKDMKEAIVRPTKTYLQKTSLFLRHRIDIHKALMKQLFQKPAETEDTKPTVYDNTSEVKKREENINSMISAIEDSHLLPSELQKNRGLINAFSGKQANNQQAYDLLNFRKIGTDDLIQYVKHRILRQPSTSTPVRRHKLLTMSPQTKVSKRNINLQKKEHDQITKCLRQRLAWCNRTGQTYDPSVEQYSTYPRAIADVNGRPHKGSKSTWTDKIGKRYQSVVLNTLPQGWIPDVAIIDGMFLINCTPLRSISNISEYAMLLFKRFIAPHFNAGAIEVHLVFDTESRRQFNPKCFEHERRDAGNSSDNHEHITFTPTTKVPQIWRTFIECRQCKRSIIQALGLAYLQLARFKLQHHHKLIVAGCFDQSTHSSPMVIHGNGHLSEPIRKYETNAEEADMIIWRHAIQCEGQRILVYSPDTDVYVIGLALMDLSREYIVQNNVPHAQDLKYVDLNALVKALKDDPDLASLPHDLVSPCFQVLFTVSGCDYISYFAGFGKAAFMNVFYQHAAFITGDETKGRLSDCSTSDIRQGYLAFLRLIGTLYFKKHYSAFVSLRGIETPQHLLNSISSTSLLDQHRAWYNDIRAVVSDRITDEDQRMPSESSIWRHWLRSCWIIQMWRNSPERDAFNGLTSPEQSGWLIHQHNGTTSWSIDWDDPQVQSKVQEGLPYMYLTISSACNICEYGSKYPKYKEERVTRKMKIVQCTYM